LSVSVITGERDGKHAGMVARPFLPHQTEICFSTDKKPRAPASGISTLSQRARKDGAPAPPPHDSHCPKTPRSLSSVWLTMPPTGNSNQGFVSPRLLHTRRRRDRMSKSHFVRIALLSIASVLTCSSWLAAASPESSVAIVIPSELPVVFVSATVESDHGRQLSTLHYSVKNTSQSPIQRFTVSAFLVGSTGNCMKGEGWSINEELTPGATKEFSTPLKNYVETGTRLTVTFASAADKATEMKIDTPQLRSSLRQVAGGDILAAQERVLMQRVRAYSGSNTPAGSCEPAFCSTNRSDALSTCLGEGCQLSTFTCSQSACSYSFACRCCTNGHCN